MNLGELVLQLGVKADTFTVKDFSRAIGDIPLSVASAITSLAGLTIGFAEMTKQVLDMTSGFQVFTAETGMNTRSLQQWQMVAKQAGLSGDIVTSSLTVLSSLMGQMRTGHVNAGAMTALGQLGIRNFQASPYEMLSQIQRGSMGMNPQAATALLGAIGISPEMMRVFQTPASVREQINPLMSQGEISQMADFQKELATFNQTVMKEFVSALEKIEPYMADLTEALVNIVRLAGGTAGIVLKAAHSALNTDDTFYASEAERRFMTEPTDRHVTVNHNITQHITSTADPMAVADEAARLSRQQHRKAAADIKNRGGG